MKKFGIYLLVLVMLLSALCTACGNQGSSVDGTTEPEPVVTEEERRQQVVDYMREMMTVAWTPEKTFSVTSGSGTQYFEAGKTYYGIPYGPEAINMEQFKEQIISTDENGVVTIKDLGDPRAEWFCVDCADAVYWAWSQISADIRFSLTGNSLCQNGVLPVGDFKYDPSLSTYATRSDFFAYVYKNNDTQTMYEAYAQLKPGDALLKNGHMIMAAAEPVIVRNADGTIHGAKSYILILEQNSKGYAQNDPNRVDRKYTFAELLGGYNSSKNTSTIHIPLTIEAFTKGEDPEVVTVTAKENATTAEFMESGSIASNYRINAVQIRAKDDTGSFREVTVYTYNFVANNGVGGDFEKPNNGEKVDMATLQTDRRGEFLDFFASLQLTSGKQYTYEIYVRVGDSDTYGLYSQNRLPVKSITFTAP